MPFFKFQIKQVYKSKFTWFSLLAILLVCCYFWLNLFQVRNQDSSDLQDAKGNLALIKNNIKEYKEQLEEPHLKPATKKKLTQELKQSERSAKDSRALTVALKRKNWQTAYHYLIKKDETALADAQRNYTGSLRLALAKRDLLYVKTLKKQKMAKENDYPIKGGFFVISMMYDVLPFLVGLAVIFFLTKLYCSGYVERMRLGNLLPQHGQSLISWASGTIMSSGYFLLIFLLVLILPSLACGFGNPNYPMATIDAGAKAFTFRPLYQLFLPTIILAILNLAFIAAFVLLFCQLFRNRTITLLIAMLTLGGGMLLPNFVVSVRKFAQYIPMTYFSAPMAVTNSFGHSGPFIVEGSTEFITYPQVNFTNGVIVLAVSTTILVCLNYFFLRDLKMGGKPND